MPNTVALNWSTSAPAACAAACTNDCVFSEWLLDGHPQASLPVHLCFDVLQMHCVGTSDGASGMPIAVILAAISAGVTPFGKVLKELYTTRVLHNVLHMWLKQLMIMHRLKASRTASCTPVSPSSTNHRMSSPCSASHCANAPIPNASAAFALPGFSTCCFATRSNARMSLPTSLASLFAKTPVHDIPPCQLAPWPSETSAVGPLDTCSSSSTP